MNGMRAAVDASAMRERGISGGIVAEHLDAKPAPRLKVGTAGQHLDLNWNDFVGLDRLALPVGVPGTAWSASLGVELTMCHAQPPLGDAIVGEPVISIEEDLLTRGVELAKQDEEVHVVAFRGGAPKPQGHSAGQFGIMLEAVDEACSITRTAARVVLDHTFIGREFGSKRPGHGIEIERNIRHIGKRPIRRGANVAHIAGLPHCQPNAWRRLPSIRLALQEVVEEATLHLTRLGRVEALPFATAVGVEPLLGRGYPLEALKRASSMEAMVGPARTNQGRHRNPFQPWALGLPISIVERMLVTIRWKVLVHREALVMAGLHAEPPPHADKARFRHAILIAQLAQQVSHPFPGANGLQ